MHIKKIMHRYYKNKIEKIEEIKPHSIPLKWKSDRQKTLFSINWINILGYALIACCILHFLLTEKWLIAGRFFLPIKILF